MTGRGSHLRPGGCRRRSPVRSPATIGQTGVHRRRTRRPGVAGGLGIGPGRCRCPWDRAEVRVVGGVIVAGQPEHRKSDPRGRGGAGFVRVGRNRAPREAHRPAAKTSGARIAPHAFAASGVIHWAIVRHPAQYAALLRPTGCRSTLCCAQRPGLPLRDPTAFPCGRGLYGLGWPVSQGRWERPLGARACGTSDTGTARASPRPRL